MFQEQQVISSKQLTCFNRLDNQDKWNTNYMER
jgi:hypothetical protein